MSTAASKRIPFASFRDDLHDCVGDGSDKLPRVHQTDDFTFKELISIFIEKFGVDHMNQKLISPENEIMDPSKCHLTDKNVIDVDGTCTYAADK